MSERPIQVGDLVALLRNHCDNRGVGFIRQVLSIDNRALRCPECRQLSADEGPVAEMEEGVYSPLAWLKRIPPLSELEGEQRREEIEA